MSLRLLREQPAPSLGFLSRDQNNTIAGGVGVVVVSLVGLTLLSRWMIRICRPNEMLVVTGSRSNQGSQGLKGYRVVANGGWTFVKPVLETDVTPFIGPVLMRVGGRDHAAAPG